MLRTQRLNDQFRNVEETPQPDSGAALELLPLVYDELRKLAAHKLAQEVPGQTLQATALVHEAWLRIAGDAANKPWNSRGHFFAAAAEAMRRILIEKVRRKQAARRGGKQERVDLDEIDIPAGNEDDDRILAINDALDELAKLDPKQAEIVKLRFFVGMRLEEIALLYGVTTKTIQRSWNHAKAWLFDRLQLN